MANRSLLIIAAAVLWIGPATAVLAQSSTSYRLDEHVVNAGGAPDGSAPSSASYSLTLVAIGDAVGGASTLASASFGGDVGFVGAYPPPGEVVGLLFHADHSMSWNPDRSAGTYNIYRGQVSTLAGGGYGTCGAQGVPAPYAQDLDTPPAGDALFYLITAVNRLAEEGTKGSDSIGSERTGGICE